MDLDSLVKKFIFKKDGGKYGYFAIVLGLSETILCFYYPYWTAFGFPGHKFDIQMIILVLGEMICFIDIILHFFMSYKDPGHTEYENDIKKIGLRYI
jgi:hypothetical protein